MRAFKYVDLDHADAVAGGSLLIGTLAGYGQLESSRRDDADGTLERHLPSFTLRSSANDPEGVALLNAMGILIGTNVENVSFFNARKIERMPPLFCFCMSRNSTSAALLVDKPQAVFEVADVYKLARMVTGKQSSKLSGLRVGPVRYKPRVVDVRESGGMQADPFIKAVRFAPEAEIRIVWQPVDERRCEPFVTQPDREVAALLRRIA